MRNQQRDCTGTWVRYSGNPIAAGVGNTVTVWENAGTYYFFVGDAGIGLLTSADGVTGFTNHGTILGAGTWDVALQIAKVIF